MKEIFSYIVHIIIIIIQILLLINYNCNYYLKKELEIERKSIEYTLNKQINPNIKEDETIALIDIKKEKLIKYDMVLEIPKLNLKKGILEKNNKDNNIEKNVMVLKQSSYPNEEGNIFLAAHSGTSIRSYFKNINKLSINDRAYIYYREIKYIYLVTNIYEVNKNNNINVKTTSLNNLFLITCSQKNKNKYLIIELKKTEN